jgi:hypothetical protein
MGMGSGEGGERGERRESGRSAHGMLRLATGAQAMEAVGLCVAGVLTAVDAAGGHSYRTSSGIGLTVFEFVVAAVLALIALGVARLRPWSRTPAVLTQVCACVAAITLLQAHRFDWGVPALVLALAGFAGLLTPASLRALAHPVEPGQTASR